MLKVKSSIEVTNITLKINDYIPITLKCADVSIDLPLYWRIGNFKNSLMTVGLNPENGAICSVVLTLSEYIQKLNEEIPFNIQYFFFGVPVCEVINWPINRYKDEEENFVVSIINDSVIITFGEFSNALAQYEIKNVIFYIDKENNLCGFKFNKIQQFDLDKIINSINF